MSKKVSIIKKIGERAFLDTILNPSKPVMNYQPKPPANAAELAETLKKQK